MNVWDGNARNPWGPGVSVLANMFEQSVKSPTLKGQLVSGQLGLVPTVFS